MNIIKASKKNKIESAGTKEKIRLSEEMGGFLKSHNVSIKRDDEKGASYLTIGRKYTKRKPSNIKKLSLNLADGKVSVKKS